MHVACMKRGLFLLALLLGVLPLSLPAAPLRVVASFLPLSAAALSIGGDRVEVSQLAGQGVGPHEFSPKPSDLKKLAGADLLLVNGLGLEEWLQEAVRKIGSSRLKVVDVSAAISPLEDPTELKLSGETKRAEGANPHAWLDPVLAQKQALAIRDAFVAADPANAAFYAANAEQYLAQLRELDEAFRAALARLPSRDLITFHDAFPYFAARYGLNYLGSVEEFPEKSPSPRALARLVDLIQSHHVKVVFSEEGYAPKLLDTIAEQSGAKVAEIDTLEVGPAEADGYLRRMRSNLAVLQKAWQ